METKVYVDASFRGQSRGLAGVAALVVRDSKLIGTAACRISARSGSHHAESQAALLGLRLSLIDNLATSIVLHSDNEGLVNQINTGHVRVRDRDTRDTIATILSIKAQLARRVVKFACKHTKAKDDIMMANADYLSKSVTCE